MTKTDLILEAIAKAERYESKLTEGPLAIGGYTGKKIRHLLNNLGEISTNYLEIGVHVGSTFVSANYKNPFETSTAVDSFIEFDEHHTAKADFLANCGKYVDRWILLEQDCWTIEPKFEKPIDFYNFDGNHSVESQRKAVTHFIPGMAQEFIMVIDDACWPSVQKGTDEGLKESGLTILFDKLLPGESDGDGWWNGFRILLCKREYNHLRPTS